MEKINGMIKDFIKCIIIGSCISLVIILLVGIVSFLLSKFNLMYSLQIVRSSLLIIGPLGVMVGALLILKKRDEKELEFIDQWKKKFNVFTYKIVLILVSFIIILYGGVIDWIIIYSI
ncbi:MAG: hypothetical protein SPH93_10760 [Clostridium sp.]|uniref:hypothetical protein n=1 Tax=Clostridium sp. TaxID=1506 RepID=UPI002A90E984|nr:hypothetical protein [Clostridium sp.]MDY6228126.1 hypothetical protein [Clostridium sp.]